MNWNNKIEMGRVTRAVCALVFTVVANVAIAGYLDNAKEHIKADQYRAANSYD